jgi:hypothetical protein
MLHQFDKVKMQDVGKQCAILASPSKPPHCGAFPNQPSG